MNSRRLRREGALVAACLFSLLLIGAAVEFTRERTPAADKDGAPDPPSVAVNKSLAGPVLLDPGVPVPLQEESSFDLGRPANQLASDGASPSSGIWSVDMTSTAATVQRLFPSAGRTLRLNTPRPLDAVDVAIWTRKVGVCAFLIHAFPDDSVAVDVRRAPGGSPIALLRSARVPRRAGSERTLQVGRWSGPFADLFVIDRAQANRTMQVRVLSGESGFKTTVLAVVVPQGDGFERRKWSLDLEDIIASGRSDLVLTTRYADTASGRTEVHVLSAQTNYSRFLLQVSTTNDAAEAGEHRSVTILRQGQPHWVLIDPRTGRAAAHPLVASPGARTSRR